MKLKVPTQTVREIVFLDVPGKSYKMGETPITNAQWSDIMGGKPPSSNQGENHPVEQVSWDDAQEFIQKWNERPEEQGGPPEGYELALPSEEEWQHCCEAGEDPPEPLSDYAVYNAESSAPVMSKLPNAWGFYDMLGNVWEWTSDEK